MTEPIPDFVNTPKPARKPAPAPARRGRGRMSQGILLLLLLTAGFAAALTLGLGFSLILPQTAQAQNGPPGVPGQPSEGEGFAADDAGNYSSEFPWVNGSNRGFGFGPWVFTTSENTSDEGFLIGNSEQGGREGINSDGAAFSLFATGSDRGAFARRPFRHNSDNTLRIGETFSFDLSFSFNAGRRGIDFWANDDGTGFLLNLEHAQSDALTFFVDGSGSRQVIVNNIFNKAVRVSIRWNGGNENNATLTVIGLNDSSINSSVDLTLSSPPRAFTILLENNTVGPNGEPYFNNFTITSEFTAPPSQSASNLIFSNIGPESVNVNWTNGDGARRLVIAREGAPVSFQPVNGTAYTANSNFINAAELGDGNKAVYDGDGSGFTLTGLQEGLTYHFAVYEYNTEGDPEDVSKRAYRIFAPRDRFGHYAFWCDSIRANG